MNEPKINRIKNRLLYYMKKYNYVKDISKVNKLNVLLIHIFYMFSKSYFSGGEKDLRRFFILLYHYTEIERKEIINHK